MSGSLRRDEKMVGQAAALADPGSIGVGEDEPSPDGCDTDGVAVDEVVVE